MIDLAIFAEFCDRVRMAQIDFHAFCSTSAVWKFRLNTCRHRIKVLSWVDPATLLLQSFESLILLELILEGLNNVRMKPLEISKYLFYLDGLHPLLFAPTNDGLVLDIEGFVVDIDWVVWLWLLVLIELHRIVLNKYLGQLFVYSELKNIVELLANWWSHVASEILT